MDMKSLSLQKKMILQIVAICTFLVGISSVSFYFQKNVSMSYRKVSSNQFPKVESLSKLVANFRLIRIKVRTLGLSGNTKKDQQKYINDTKNAIGSFLKEKEKFNKMSFTAEEKNYVMKMNSGWESFFNFGKDLLSKYERPTKESLVEGSNMIRKICPIEANKWMSVAQGFLKYQSDKTSQQVTSSIKRENSILMMSSLGLLFSFLISIFLGFLFSQNITRKILGISNVLKSNTDQVKSSSQSVFANSTKLNETASSSSSSLQNTTASMDEISSMIERNSESAKRSTTVASKSINAVTEGKRIIDTMIRSVDDIAKANDKIAVEMLKSNEEISEIIEVINQISEKTNVINDIVFQTKLLSFNASVESARAGEHGKGFAVVAEEVGNLAAMSGKAASEIAEMLDKSITQVSGIVENTKTKVEDLVSSSKDKVNVGNQTAGECGKALDEILLNVNSVNDMTEEISTASREQSLGVQEVTQSMQQLDQSTRENSSIAEESLNMADRLSEQASSLEDVVLELVGLVSGQGKSNTQNAQVLELSSQRDIKQAFSEQSEFKKVSS